MICSAQDYNAQGVHAAAPGKCKRSNEGIKDNEPFRILVKYCIGCLAIKEDTENKH